MKISSIIKVVLFSRARFFKLFKSVYDDCHFHNDIISIEIGFRKLHDKQQKLCKDVTL